MSRPRKDRLGRGLGALLGDYMDAPADAGEVRRIPVRAVVPNPLQPRQEFSDAELGELAASIRENGLLQPLVVRPSPTTEGRYELVAGERRFRSVQGLGWEDVPVLVRDVDDEALLVLALVENLQREQLNPLEEAEGYQSLIQRFDMTQEEIARAVGKDRSTVANCLRLLKLPVSIRQLLRGGEISMGHARALLGVEDPVRAGDLARQAVKEGWSVREVERRVRGSGGSTAPRKVGPAPVRDPLLRTLEEALRGRLGTRVQIRRGGKGKGVIEVPFHDTEDFERVFALITGVEASEVVD
jgi:ParB family transcriptional regulator, chromosome partitioning protein